MRYALAERYPGYLDERVSVADVPEGWAQKRSDRNFSGPFGTLPVLVFDVTEVAQTLVIADYLARRGGDYPEQDDRPRLVQQMALTCAYTELIEPYGQLFSVRSSEGPGFERRVAQQAQRSRERIEQLERLLPLTSPYFAGLWPGMADFFVFEAIREAHSVFGRYEHHLLAHAPRLRALCHTIEHMPRVREEIARAPHSLTGSPREPEIREAIDRLGMLRD